MSKSTRFLQNRSSIAATDSRRALSELDANGPPLKERLRSFSRVVWAIYLRDIQTRVAGTRFGFLLSLGQPLAHIGIVLTIYYLLGRVAPIGTDTIMFIATGALPFVVWLYGFRQIKMAPQQNKSLTHFPGVTLMDLLFARSFVELLSSTCVCIFTLGSLAILGFDVIIFDAPKFVFFLFQTYLLGISMGIFFAVLARMFFIFLIIGNLLVPVTWLTCGSMFIPSMLPEALAYWIWFLPLSQLVDATRTAFYGHYLSDFYSESYISGITLGFAAIGVTLMYLMRTKLSQN
ncbi:ABC transporter permease [Ancylobacter oerskovii]|uniref:ABC transporter permease n=1 Tax=Ancylobacter oerskovii TaxID=459519 RepID=A0ABW4Z4F4_9HYPH|nr:ABC transporter permease [Ancylobacter oerskovii]MBS7544297.1 ABC transporter permease [Ancylobacter oerskovii]